MGCKNFKGIVRASSDKREIIHVVRCKMWSCPYCAEVNKKVWQGKLIRSTVEYQLANPDTQWAFLTITLPPEIHALKGYEMERAQVELIKNNWDMLMKRFKRAFGKFQYVRVLESHKSGVLHIHLLINAHVQDSALASHYPKQWDENKRTYHHSDIVQNHAVECGFGRIHDAKNLAQIGQNSTENALSIVGYILKYISKSLDMSDEVQRSYRLRKIQVSQAFLTRWDKAYESELEWRIAGRLSLLEFIAGTREGIEFIDTVKGKLSGDDFGLDDYYPTFEEIE